MSQLTYAFRTLMTTPVVSLVAIASLALGIGANTAIFSVFDQILLQRLPVHEPERLANLTANGPRNGSNSTNIAGNSTSTFSYGMFRDLEKGQQVFTGLAAHTQFGVNLAYKGQASSGDGMLVSGSYFPVLQLVPLAGRLFDPSDDKTPGAHRVVVLSARYWTNQFNRDPAILKNQLTVNGVAMTVIGVAPEGFYSTSLGAMPDVFVPISMQEMMAPGGMKLDDRRHYWIYLFGRLKDGVSLKQAEAAMNPLFHGILESTDLALQKNMSDQTRQRFRTQTMTLEDGSRGQSSVLTQGQAPLAILLAITGLVLLIACANVANLLLARAAGRAREISVRMAIGARRGQVISQLLTESVVLSVISAVAGLLVSYVTIRLLISFLPPEALLPLSASVDRTSLLFALGAAIVTGLLFGLFPALHATRQDLVTAIKDDAGSVSSSGSAALFRKVLVTGQMALSLLLLISAGLFLKSLVNLTRVDLGLRTKGVLAFRLAPFHNQYNPDQTRDFFQRLEENVAAIPGVESVTASAVPLLTGSNWGTDVYVDGFDAGLDTDRHTSVNIVGPSFFRTLNIPILAGREFTPADGLAAPKVAIVNEAFVRKFSPSDSILGKRMRRGGDGTNDTEIVGVARDTKYNKVKDPAPPLLYTPYRQNRFLAESSFYVFSRRGSPTDLAPDVRQAVANLDANLPIQGMTTFERQVEENIFVDRMVTTLAAAFAVLATVLAAVGLYGVLAYSVARRTREIGIRLAIGADPSQVLWMVLKEVGWMTLIGAVLGAPAAMALAKLAESQLYGIKSYDPPVVLGATLLIVLVALVAGYFPARFAMRVEPQLALRHD
jgi:predicted permease